MVNGSCWLRPWRWDEVPGVFRMYVHQVWEGAGQAERTASAEARAVQTSPHACKQSTVGPHAQDAATPHSPVRELTLQQEPGVSRRPAGKTPGHGANARSVPTPELWVHDLQTSFPPSG